MRILHVAGRVSERGGADVCLLGVLAAQAGAHVVHLAVGDDDGTVSPPCAVSRVPGLSKHGSARR